MNKLSQINLFRILVLIVLLCIIILLELKHCPILIICIIQNEQTIANEFISYFSSCCSTLHYNIARIESLSHTDYLCDPVSQTLYFNAKTENGLFEVCKLFKKNTYLCGYDNISCKVFKQILYLITKPLE